jgi:DNA-binding GntR family transcriptional regulator
MHSAARGDRRLESDGLVVSKQCNGTVLSSRLPAEREELFGIRKHLQKWLFKTTVPCMTHADFDHADTLIDEAMRTGEVEDWGELDWRFHEVLYQASGSKIALKLLRSAHDNAARYVTLKLVLVPDVERGADMLRRHISRVSRNLTALLADKQDRGLKNIA